LKLQEVAQNVTKEF